MKHKLTTLILFILIALNTKAQKINIKKIDEFVSHIEKHNRDIGSISISKNGKEIYFRSFGQANLKGTSFDENTKYQIGSITKMFTAVLIFKLIEQGKLTLDNKLSEFYPDIPNADKITIKHLLEHSSGLGDYVTKGDDGTWLTKHATETQILEEIKRQGTDFKAGKKVQYSNSGYFLLARIVEKKYESSYADALEKYIIKPNELAHFQSVLSKPTNIAKSYSYNGETWTEIEEFDFTNVVGVGDIAATTRELNKFITNFFQYKVLNKESVELMKPTRKESFGRGLMLVPFYNHLFYGHGGDTYGTHSVVGYNSADSIAISYIINGERYPTNDFAIGVLSILYEKDFTFPVFKDIKLTADDLNKYIGVYSAPKFPFKITIAKDKNTLTAQATGQSSFPLEAYDIDKFQFEQAAIKMGFRPLSNTMIFQQGGETFELKKE